LTFNFQRSKQHQGDLNRTRQADSGDFRLHKLEEIVAGGEGKRSNLQDSIKCVMYIRSEVKLDTFVNSAFHCTEGLVLRNTIR